MRRVLYLLHLLLITTTAMAEDLILYRIYFEGGVGCMNFLVPSEELEKVPTWEPVNEQPPQLTRNQAFEIAKKAATAEGIETTDTSELSVVLTKTNPFEVELVKRFPPRCCRWFYIVHLRGQDDQLRGKYTYLVTMNGHLANKLIDTD